MQITKDVKRPKYDDDSLRRWGVAILRVVVGAIFVIHGGQKAFVLGVSSLAITFEKLHIPLPITSAFLITALELIAGSALILGVITRWASVLLAIDMAVAVLLTYLKPSFFVKAGIELPIILLAALVALAASGPGAASLQFAIKKRI